MTKKELLYATISGITATLLTFTLTSLAPLNAQDEPEDTTFNEITCRRIIITDDYGHTTISSKMMFMDGKNNHTPHLQLSNKKGGCAVITTNSMGGLIQVSGNDLGDGSDGHVTLSNGSYGGHIMVQSRRPFSEPSANIQLFIEPKGAGVTVVGNSGLVNLETDEHGGVVSAQNTDGKAYSKLSNNEYGGNLRLTPNTQLNKNKPRILQPGNPKHDRILLEHGMFGPRLLIGNESGYATVSTNEHGGSVQVYTANVNSSNPHDEGAAHLIVDEHGGDVRVWGRGKGQATLSINEKGNGAISTWDKHGYRQ